MDPPHNQTGLRNHAGRPASKVIAEPLPIKRLGAADHSILADDFDAISEAMVSPVTEAQRERVPREDGSELATALSFLQFARNCVVKKTDGLDADQMRRQLVPSGTSLLGMVQHLADGERYWFGHHVAGDPKLGDLDFSMDVPTEREPAAVLEGYRAACDESDDVLRHVGSLDARVQLPIDGEYLTVRWVVAHMTSETARHAGHADILREQIDGVTGR
jgi:hypothetical protein